MCSSWSPRAVDPTSEPHRRGLATSCPARRRQERRNGRTTSPVIRPCDARILDKSTRALPTRTSRCYFDFGYTISHPERARLPAAAPQSSQTRSRNERCHRGFGTTMMCTLALHAGVLAAGSARIGGRTVNHDDGCALTVISSAQSRLPCPCVVQQRTLLRVNDIVSLADVN